MFDFNDLKVECQKAKCEQEEKMKEKKRINEMMKNTPFKRVVTFDQKRVFINSY